MRIILLIILATTLSLCNAQQSKILLLVNTSFPVTHGVSSHKILKRHAINRDSMDMQIISRASYFTLRDLDTSHYIVSRKTIEQIGGKSENIYPFINYDDIRSPYVRPKMDKLQKLLSSEYDYIVSINKIDFLSEFGVDKLQLWVSIYDGSYTELTSKKFASKINISKSILPSAMLQVMHQPCEEIEERILHVIDHHRKQYLTYASYDDYLANNKWMQASLKLSNSDSLLGEIQYINPYKISFRLSSESPTRHFEAHQIKELNFPQLSYRTIFVPHISSNLGKHVLGRVIADGKLKLYEVEHEGLARYYLSNDRSAKDLLRVRLTPDLKRINNRQSVAAMLGDYEELSEKVFSRRFGIKDLEKIVFKYNCLSSNH